MNTTGRPRMLAVSSIVSRVVPGIGETMARSWPSNWLSRLDLPAFGRPTIAARMPRRRICPSFAVRSSSSMNAMPRSRPATSCVLRVGRDVFVGKINVRLDVRQRLHQVVAQLVDALRQFAGELFVGGAQREFGARMNQVGDGLGLREVNAPVEKGAPGEFAGFGQARAVGQHGVEHELWRAECRRDR